MSKQVAKNQDIKSTDLNDTVEESANIKNFITTISTKKYALAHKYLKQVVEDKIAARISSSLNEPLF